jgi:hypothetical protein
MLLVALGLVSALAQAAVQVTTPTVVTGRVIDQTSGAGVADARVMLFPMAAPGRNPPVFDGRPPMALTDRDGRYTFQNIAPGRYQINAQKTGFAPSTDGRLPNVEVAAGERREVTEIALQRGAAIVGRVLDENGEPAVGARVAALRRMPRNGRPAAAPAGMFISMAANAESNDLGEFRLFGLAPGEYLVAATAASLMTERVMPRDTTVVPTYFPGTSDADAAQPLIVSSGQTYSDVTIRLVSVRAFQVSGLVRYSSGAPVTNALVTLRPAQESPSVLPMMNRLTQAHTDAAGRFTIANVTVGQYTLLAEPPIVISQAGNRGGGGGVGGAQFGYSTGMVAGVVQGAMSTETRNGVTTQWREDMATRLPIAIADSDMQSLDIVVRSPNQAP